MSLPIFVEILNPDGSVHSRQSFHHLPIRIGRAYDNEVILDDPHTGAHHALIEQNQLDELVLRDLGSVNGISLNNERENDFVVDGNAQYRLGHTRLRIRSRHFEVAPELEDAINHRWEGWKPALSGLLLAALTSLANTWFNDLSQSDFSRYLLALIYMLIAALGWSGVWALLGRLFTGHAHFGRQLFITGAAFLVFECWENLSSLLAYAFSWETLANFTSHPSVLIFAVVLYFQLRTAGFKKPERLKFYLTGLMLLTSAVILTKQYQASNHFADQLYLSRLYPPSMRLSANEARDGFIADMRHLQEQVDKDRKPNPDKD